MKLNKETLKKMATAFLIYAILCGVLQIRTIQNYMPLFAREYIARDSFSMRLCSFSPAGRAVYRIASASFTVYKTASVDGVFNIFKFFFDLKDAVIEKSQNSFDV